MLAQETTQIAYYRRAFTRSKKRPSLLICDEGHKIKNSDSLYAKALTRILTPNKIVLTGTPIQVRRPCGIALTLTTRTEQPGGIVHYRRLYPPQLYGMLRPYAARPP